MSSLGLDLAIAGALVALSLVSFALGVLHCRGRHE